MRAYWKASRKPLVQQSVNLVEKGLSPSLERLQVLCKLPKGNYKLFVTKPITETNFLGYGRKDQLHDSLLIY